MNSDSGRTRLRELLAADACTPVAPIFDPLSARIAQATGWQVCNLSGSVIKAANLALPDGIHALVNISDFADVVCQVRSVAPDIILSIDIDDAGGTRLSVFRTVRELEAAGISSIEIDDRVYPTRFVEGGQDGIEGVGQQEANGSGPSDEFTFHPLEEQVSLLRTAVAARQDPATVIIARTAAFSELLPSRASALTPDQVLQRVRAYSAAGIDAIMIPGTAAQHVRSDIEAVHRVTDLPLCVLRMPREVADDKPFLVAKKVRLRYLGQPVVYRATRAIYESLKSLKEGGSGDRRVTLDVRGNVPERTVMLKLVSRWSEFAQIDHTYGE